MTLNTPYQRLILLLVLLASLLISCRKQVTEPKYESPFDETSSAYVPTPGLNTAPITSITALAAITGGVFENNYGKPATAKGVCWSLVESPTLTSSCTNDGSGTTSFTSSLTNLLPDTLYYVRAYATNEAGTIYGGQRSFRTRDGIAIFGEAKVMSVLAKSATFYAVVTSDGSAPITRKGFVWATRALPTLQDSVVFFAGGLGSATHPLSNLRPGVEYHVRAYTESAARVTYSAPVVFTTQTGQPVFSNLGITGVTSNGATVSTTIDSDGGDALTERGVCYSKEPDPTTEDTCIASASGTDAYSVTLSGLDRATAYYVRPYAINSVMTGYGAQASFVTAADLPSVETGIASLIGATSATVSGNVTSDGGSNQTSRGICYATTQNPTTANTCVASGTGAGAFEAVLTGLNMGTIYFARSYATNPIGTTYGSQVSFTTLTGPTVSTGAVSNLSSTGATIAGNVSADGGSTVTARGVCYSINQNPTLADTCLASGSGTGAFNASLSGLSRGTTYYARAYATNAVATSYGSQVSLTTHDVPTVTTGAISAITSTSATVAGNVTAAGGVTVTARGICYSTSQNPTTSGTCLASGSGTGAFTANLGGLSFGTTYYVRAYAINSVGTAYGVQTTLTTLAMLPTVTTGLITNITASGATIAGNVTASGGATVTARGVCYSTSQNPTISGTCTTAGSGTGLFSASLTGLSAGTLYYVRAYATNSAGTEYGSQISFRTIILTGTVTDIDGNVYPTVQIGTQIWMAENLKTTRYRNGQIIPNVMDPIQWSNSFSGAWSNYNNNAANDATYGKLYDWYAISKSGGLCPVDWHVPSENEWLILLNYLGVDAGYALKSNTGWADGSNGSNESGYGGLPGGQRAQSGVFAGLGNVANFWSSTSDTLDYAIYYYLGPDRTFLRHDNPKKAGFSIRCIKASSSQPIITTGNVNSVTINSANIIGTIPTSGGETIIDRGVCFSITQNPSLSDSCVSSGLGTGSFSTTISGLQSGTRYYARAYASSNSTTYFGSQTNFTTLGTPTVADVDGNVYSTIQIGTQVWMTSNLKTTRYRNGTSIPNVTDANIWSNLTTGAWAIYDNATVYNTTYGKLYNWFVVSNTAGLCPAGWHVPSYNEWTVLSNFLSTDVGAKMKSISGWSNNGNGSNTSGYNGLPGGRRTDGGTYTDVSNYGFFWSSSEASSSVAWNGVLYSSSNDFNRFNIHKQSGFSVRCIRD
jgi:uncharacterized protein (TIGR02145 family)